MNDTTAREQVELERAEHSAEALRALGEMPLPDMSASIAAVRCLDDELANDLTAMKEEWWRRVAKRASAIERAARVATETTQLMRITAEMRRAVFADMGKPKRPAARRMETAVKRVLAAHGPLTHLAVATELPDAS